MKDQLQSILDILNDAKEYIGKVLDKIDGNSSPDPAPTPKPVVFDGNTAPQPSKSDEQPVVNSKTNVDRDCDGIEDGTPEQVKKYIDDVFNDIGKMFK